MAWTSVEYTCLDCGQTFTLEYDLGRGMQINMVKVWETRQYNYCKEEGVSFGAQAQAILDTNEGDSSEHAMEAIKSLFTTVVDPALKAEIKDFASRSSSFRLAMETVKPQIIRRFTAQEGV